MIALPEIENLSGPAESPSIETGETESARLFSDAGAFAELSNSTDNQTLRIFSDQNQLVFEYDPATGRTRLNIPAGDLEVTTQAGNIEFSASEKIRFHADQIEMTARNGICLGIINGLQKLVSNFRLDPQRIQLTSTQTEFTSKRMDVNADETHWIGQRFEMKLRLFRVFAKRLESISDNMIQKSKNVYQKVSQLLQSKAGRKRTVVDSTYHLKAERTNMKAEDSFKIDGKKIHVG